MLEDLKALVTSFSFAVTVFAAPAAQPTQPARPAYPARPAEVMMRIVFRDPAQTPGSFASQPKTIYRIDSRFARLEERPDEEQGIHGLIIANMRDVWMINLANKTGIHVIDDGPTFGFHAPLVPGDPKQVPETLRELEIGTELKFIEERGLEPSGKLRVGNVLCDVYADKKGDYKVEVLVRLDRGTPYETRVYHRGVFQGALRYDEYETRLAADMALFRPPDGIEIREPGEPPPPGMKREERSPATQPAGTQPAR